MNSITGEVDETKAHATVSFIKEEVTNGYAVFWHNDDGFFQVSEDGTNIQDETGADLEIEDLALIASAAVSALNYAVNVKEANDGEK